MTDDSTSGNEANANRVYRNTFFLEKNISGSGYRTGFVVRYGGRNYMISSKDLVSDSKDVSEIVVIRGNVPPDADVPDGGFEFKWIGSGIEDCSFSVMEVLSPVNRDTPEIFSSRKASITDDIIYMGFPKGRKGVLFENGFIAPLVYKGSVSSSRTINGFWDPTVNGSPIIVQNQRRNNEPCVLGVACGKGYEGNKPLYSVDSHGHFSMAYFSDVLKVIDDYQGENSE